jgi:hypothetical protein
LTSGEELPNGHIFEETQGLVKEDKNDAQGDQDGGEGTEK